MNKEPYSPLVEAIELFVIKEKRQLFLTLCAQPKRRGGAMWELLHDPRNFDLEVIDPPPDRERSHEAIRRRLKSLGCNDSCWSFSVQEERHERRVDLRAALSAIADTDTLLFCPESKAGFYEGHEGWRYILRRPAKL
jgi:hypothetical protein